MKILSQESSWICIKTDVLLGGVRPEEEKKKKKTRGAGSGREIYRNQSTSELFMCQYPDPQVGAEVSYYVFP